MRTGNNEHIKTENSEEVTLLDYLIVILKRKKMILGVTFFSAVITAAISLIMTPIYRAETRILPPQQSSSSISAQVLSQLGGASGLVGSSLGLKNPNEVYLGILKSRTIYDRVIDRFGLMELYEADYKEDARGKLNDSMTVTTGKDEIISVSVEDEDPTRAADMANALVEELKGLTQTLAITEASQRRLFFENQLKNVKENLIQAEESLKNYQEKTGAIKIEEQAEAVIESIAQLRAQVAAKEVELKVMKTFATAQNPDLQKVQEELRGMQEELLKLETKEGKNPDPLMPTERMPAIGTGYIRKMRDLKYYETLFDLMAKQYEIARVDEARDATIIQVLDKAVPPEKRAKPRRTFMVAVATFAGFFLALFAAFFMEYLERVSEDPENRETLEALRRYSFFRRRRS